MEIQQNDILCAADAILLKDLVQSKPPSQVETSCQSRKGDPGSGFKVWRCWTRVGSANCKSVWAHLMEKEDGKTAQVAPGKSKLGHVSSIYLLWGGWHQIKKSFLVNPHALTSWDGGLQPWYRGQEEWLVVVPSSLEDSPSGVQEVSDKPPSTSPSTSVSKKCR